ncbi:hypothetical protein ACN38_g5473 [Penicillium nordicum]|uniref:Uncharacterized protein n=1 Tax=Penicillium nordicum TaxID=229535 RepID=A0A0M8P1L4_9EURO|nr:hypothetical protein ACN38_g5473 [Penicillium nordicum]
MSDVCLHRAFPSHRHDFSLIHLPHLSPAFCPSVPGQPGADWGVKRGTSSPCWNATSNIYSSSFVHHLHFIFHLTLSILRFSCSPFIPRLLLTGPGATWCRLGSEEREFVVMFVLQRLLPFILPFPQRWLAPHRGAGVQ